MSASFDESCMLGVDGCFSLRGMSGCVGAGQITKSDHIDILAIGTAEATSAEENGGRPPREPKTEGGPLDRFSATFQRLRDSFF